MKYIYILIIFTIIFLLFINRKNIEKYQENIIPCSKNYNSTHPNFPHKQIPLHDTNLNSCTSEKPRCKGYIPNQTLGKCIGPALRKKEGNYEYTIKTKYKNRGRKKGKCFGNEIPHTKSYTTYQNCKNQCAMTDYCQGFEYDYNKELCTLFNKPKNHSNTYNGDCDGFSRCNEEVMLRQHWLNDKSGWEALFPKGYYSNFKKIKNGVRNDDASSIIVPKGCVAHVFKHKNFNETSGVAGGAAGARDTYREGSHNLNEKGIRDNEITSMIVEDELKLDNIGFFEKTKEIKTIIDRTRINYNDVNKDPLYNCLDPRFPYSSDNGEKCYNNYKFVKDKFNSNDCNNWCTNNPKKVNRCGKLCNTIQKSIINDETCTTKIKGICERDTQYIKRHEVLKDYTIFYTVLNPLGIKINNKNIEKSYKTIKILFNIDRIKHIPVDEEQEGYVTIFIKTNASDEISSKSINISTKSAKFFRGNGLENVDDFYLVIPYTSHYIPTNNGAIIAKNNCGKSEHLAKSSKFTDLTFKSIKTKIEMAKALGNKKIQQSAENELSAAIAGLNEQEKNALELGMSNLEKAKGIRKINKNKPNNQYIKNEYRECKYDFGTHKDCDNNEVKAGDPYICPEYKNFCVGYDKQKNVLGVCQENNSCMDKDTGENCCEDKDTEENCLIGRKILYIIPNKTKHWNLTSGGSGHPDYYRKCNYNWNQKVGLNRHLPLQTTNINFRHTAKIDTDINCIQAKEEAKKCNLIFVKDPRNDKKYLIKGKNKPSCKIFKYSNSSNFSKEDNEKATENIDDCIKRFSQWKDQAYMPYMEYTNCNGEVQANINHQKPLNITSNDYKYEYIGCYSDNAKRNLKNGPGYFRSSTTRKGDTYDIKQCLKECRYSKYVALQQGGKYCYCDDQIRGNQLSFTECNSSGKNGFGKGKTRTNAIYSNKYYNKKYGTPNFRIVESQRTPWTYTHNQQNKLQWLLKHNIKCNNKGYLNSIKLNPSGQKWFNYSTKCINHDIPKRMVNMQTDKRIMRDNIHNLIPHEIKCESGLLHSMQLKKKNGYINYDYKCNGAIKTKNCTQHITPPSEGTGIRNEGKACWRVCKKGGLCHYCGTGKCCRIGWHKIDGSKDDTCGPLDGMKGKGHVCVKHDIGENVNSLKHQLNCPNNKGLSRIKMEKIVVGNCLSTREETIKLIEAIEGKSQCIYNIWVKKIARDTGDHIRFDREVFGGQERFTIYAVKENGKNTDRIIMKGGRNNQNCGRQWGKNKILCKGNESKIARNSDGSVQELQLQLVGGNFNRSLGAWPVYITEFNKFGKNKKWFIPGKEYDSNIHLRNSENEKGDIFIIGHPDKVTTYDGVFNGCHRELPKGTVLPGHKFSYTCCDTEGQESVWEQPTENEQVSVPTFGEIPKFDSAKIIDDSLKPNPECRR